MNPKCSHKASCRTTDAVRYGLVGLILLGSPGLGAMFARLPLEKLSEFPPRSLYVAHLPFSRLWFFVFALAGAALLVAALSVVLSISNRESSAALSARPLPFYGRAGLILTMASWFIAWTRIESLRPIQQHTFFPLWLSFILVANAVADRRAVSPLRARPLRYLLLFPLSSLVWWYFEFLNRFVQNWVYENVSNFSAGDYLLFATLSFSTVLPATCACTAALESLPFIRQALTRVPAPSQGFQTERFLLPATAVGAILLFLLPLFPNALFPAVWLAPTIIVIAAFEHVSPGRFFGPNFLRQVVIWSLSGLLCGFFWELWNYGSFARWTYRVPLVSRFYLFEMPLLGYGGYIPFGVLCGIINHRVLEQWADHRRKDLPPHRTS